MLNNKPGQASRQAGRHTAHTHTHTHSGAHKSNNKMQLHALHTFGLAPEAAAIAEAGSKLLGNHKKLKGLLDLRFY